MERRVIGIISRYDMVKMFREYGISFSSTPKAKQSSSGKKSYFWIYIVVLAIAGATIYYLLS